MVFLYRIKGFQVLTFHNMVFWVLTPYSLAVGNIVSEEFTASVYHEDGSSMYN
jgi:hypothetical protein